MMQIYKYYLSRPNNNRVITQITQNETVNNVPKAKIVAKINFFEDFSLVRR